MTYDSKQSDCRIWLYIQDVNDMKHIDKGLMLLAISVPDVNLSRSYVLCFVLTLKYDVRFVPM